MGSKHAGQRSKPTGGSTPATTDAAEGHGNAAPAVKWAAETTGKLLELVRVHPRKQQQLGRPELAGNKLAAAPEFGPHRGWSYAARGG